VLFFGGELAAVLVVGLLVFGPKELPLVLGKLGRLAGKARR
jgi:Sec-independent protein translocase protein TatA